MGYTTVSQVRTHLAREIAATSVSRVEELIEEATTLVDSETGLTWRQTSGSRRFECDGSVTLRIDPALSVTSVVLHQIGYDPETLVEGDDEDWIAEPGGAGEGVSPEAIVGLRRVGLRWPPAPSWAEVTATWAMASGVPTDIALATAFIVAAWCRAQGIGSSAAADVKSESWDGYSVSYGDGVKSDSPRSIPPEAQAILARYRSQAEDEPWAVGV